MGTFQEGDLKALPLPCPLVVSYPIMRAFKSQSKRSSKPITFHMSKVKVHKSLIRKLRTSKLLVTLAIVLQNFYLEPHAFEKYPFYFF